MTGDSARIEWDGGVMDGAFPVRLPVWWARRGESGPHPDLPGVSGRFIVLRHPKRFLRFEGILARMLKGPKELRRTLDDMNSLLWELCDGHRDFEEICAHLNKTFHERIDPVAERAEAALRQLNTLGFLAFSREEFEDHWPTGPGIDPSGELEVTRDSALDSTPIPGDRIDCLYILDPQRAHTTWPS